MARPNSSIYRRIQSGHIRLGFVISEPVPTSKRACLLAAIFQGLSVHLKIYPVMYSVAIMMYLTTPALQHRESFEHAHTICKCAVKLCENKETQCDKYL